MPVVKQLPRHCVKLSCLARIDFHAKRRILLRRAAKGLADAAAKNGVKQSAPECLYAIPR